MSRVLLDAAGRPRSPATLAGFHAGRSPRNEGQRYPADPPTVRIHEALTLGEADLDSRRGSLLVRRGKGGRRREVGRDARAWEQLQPWPAARAELPVGPLPCIANGPTRGRAWSAGAARTELRQGIDSTEIIDTVHARRPPMVPVEVSLRL